MANFGPLEVDPDSLETTAFFNSNGISLPKLLTIAILKGWWRRRKHPQEL